MKLSSCLLSALVSLSTYVSAAESSDVMDLSTKSTEEFNKFVEDHPLVLAKFFAPWCGHCKRLAPEYEIAATELKEQNIALVEVDCEQNQALCAEHKIQGYPTLFVFKSLDSKSQYQGGRTAEDIVKYMKKELLPSSTKVTEENLEEFKSLGPVSVIGFTNEKESNATFTTVSDALHHEYNIGFSNDVEFAKSFGVSSFPALVVLSDYLDAPSVYDAESAGEDFEFNQDNLALAIIRASIAPAGEIAPETFRAYMTSKLPLGYIFYNTVEERETYEKAILPIAKEVKNKLSIGLIDASKFGSHAGNLNLEESFPAFSIHDMEKNRKYPLLDKEFSIDNVIEFVKDFVAGKIEPNLKSDPIPESQDGPVYTVVGLNYDEIVLDDEKDVLIEFYAPWCGHCKQLAPTYEELGALYFNNDDFKDKVVVAKIDHPSNEVDNIAIQGYPTIMLFPAGKKSDPITFNGARNLEALSDFIKDNGTHKVDGIAASKKAAPKVKKAKKSKRSKKAGKKAKKEAKKAEAVNDEL
ncbi:hypothetical protein D0Z00_004575 [Geotrichum galactomycetum]|uniref:Uncharacterized protein n=1 Tax=Geotrichum galactomycetum TaxID=27317 RepID=A0ACB6UY26_9ASCO|nr:hypothetical protein D0Z00_004575 [Geotrichum candidum]